MISMTAPPTLSESDYASSSSSSHPSDRDRQFSSLSRSQDDNHVSNGDVMNYSSPANPSNSRVSELRQRNRPRGVREDEEESGLRNDDSYAFTNRADDIERLQQHQHQHHQSQQPSPHRNRSASVIVPNIRTPVALHAASNVLSPSINGAASSPIDTPGGSVAPARSFLSPSGVRTTRPPSPLHIQHGLLLADRDRISREQMQLVALNQLSVHSRTLHSQSLSVSGRVSANESGATSPTSGSRYMSSSLSASTSSLSGGFRHSNSLTSPMRASTAAMAAQFYANEVANAAARLREAQHQSELSRVAAGGTAAGSEAASLSSSPNSSRRASIAPDSHRAKFASPPPSASSAGPAGSASGSSPYSMQMHIPPFAASPGNGGTAAHPTTFIVRMQKLNRRIASRSALELLLRSKNAREDSGASAGDSDAVVIRKVHWDEKAKLRLNGEDLSLLGQDELTWSAISLPPTRVDLHLSPRDEFLLSVTFAWSAASGRVSEDECARAKDYFLDALERMDVILPPGAQTPSSQAQTQTFRSPYVPREQSQLSPNQRENIQQYPQQNIQQPREQQREQPREQQYPTREQPREQPREQHAAQVQQQREQPQAQPQSKPIPLTIPTTVSDAIVAVPVMVKTVPTSTIADVMATSMSASQTQAPTLGGPAEVAALAKPPIIVTPPKDDVAHSVSPPPPSLLISSSPLTSPSHSLLALPSSSSAFTSTTAPKSSFLFPIPPFHGVGGGGDGPPSLLSRSRSLGSVSYATEHALPGEDAEPAPIITRSIPSSPSMCPTKASLMVISAFASPKQGAHNAPDYVPMYNENGVELVQPITINPRTGRPRVLKRFARRYAGLILAHIARENAESATREAMEYRARKKKALEESEMGSGRIPQLIRQQSHLHGQKQTMGAFLTSIIAGNTANKESSEIARSAAAQQRALNDLLGEDPTQRGTEAAGGDNSSQIESFHQSGNIFNAILKADRKAVDALLRANPHVLSQRGPVGELPLHMCILYASPAHHVLAFYLMSRCPHVIAECYTGTEYTGENILHIAIIQQDTRMATRLVAKEPLLINATATGAFFSRGQPCYYGEYPLYFACCTGQLAMATLLINAGASMDSADSNGNNALHLMVIHSRPEMYTYVKKCWIERNGKLPHYEQCPLDNLLWKRQNKEGFTPMTLSAKMGNMGMFSFLLEEEKQKQWAYGPISCFVYPLEQIDVPLDDDTKFKKSADEFEQPRALELIVNEAHLDLLMHPRMIELINQKWERFAARIFFQRFMVVFLYLVCFTATTIHRQTENIVGIEAWNVFEDHLLLYQNQTAHIDASHAIRIDVLADLDVHASVVYAGMLVDYERDNTAAMIRSSIPSKDPLPTPTLPDLIRIRAGLLTSLGLPPLPTLVALEGIDMPDLVARLARANEKAASRENAGIDKRRKKVEVEGVEAEVINISTMTAEALHEMLTPPPMQYDDGVLGELFDLLCDLAVHPPKAWLTIAWQYPILLLIGELIVVGGAVFKGNNEFGEMADRGVNNYFGAAGSAFFENMLSLIFSSLMIIVLVLSMSGSYLVRMFMGLASMIGWSYIFFFLLAFRMTGPMIVMIYQMLTSDVIRFLTVFGVFLVAFAQAFFVLFDGDGFGGFVASVQTCFLAMLGDFAFDDYTSSPYKEVSVALLLTYVVVVTILLLNLLVAMMGDTYEKVNEQAEMQWHLERARIIFAIEHEMESDVRGKKSNKYWTVIGGKRYLQVMVEDPDHFRTKKADA